MNGGRRPNSGRKVGSQNLTSQELRKQIIESGTSPLEFLIDTMRNPKKDFSVRFDAAKVACAFIHPRLQSMNIVTTETAAAAPTEIQIVFVKPGATPLNTQPPLPQLSVGHQVHQEIEDHTFVPNLF